MPGDDILFDEQHKNGLIKIITDVTSSQTEILKTEIQDIKRNISEEIVKTRKDINDLKNKYGRLRRLLKKNNIIIFGLETANNNVLDITLQTIRERLNIDISHKDIDYVYAVGRSNDRRPIIVKFVSFLKKKKILINARRLRGRNIFIAEDLSLEDRLRNKTLRKHLKIARGRSFNAYIKYNKLHVDGEVYTPEQLKIKDEDDLEVFLEKKSNSALPNPTIRSVDVIDLCSDTDTDTEDVGNGDGENADCTPVKTLNVPGGSGSDNVCESRRLRQLAGRVNAGKSGDLKNQTVAKTAMEGSNNSIYCN